MLNRPLLGEDPQTPWTTEDTEVACLSVESRRRDWFGSVALRL